MSRTLWLVILCSTLGACASVETPNAGNEAYEEPDVGIGSNIPSRARRAAATAEQRERAQAELDALRTNQTRSAVPRSGATR